MLTQRLASVGANLYEAHTYGLCWGMRGLLQARCSSAAGRSLLGLGVAAMQRQPAGTAICAALVGLLLLRRPAAVQALRAVS